MNLLKNSILACYALGMQIYGLYTRLQKIFWLLFYFMLDPRFFILVYLFTCLFTIIFLIHINIFLFLVKMNAKWKIYVQYNSISLQIILNAIFIYLFIYLDRHHIFQLLQDYSSMFCFQTGQSSLYCHPFKVDKMSTKGAWKTKLFGYHVRLINYINISSQMHGHDSRIENRKARILHEKLITSIKRFLLKI